MMTDTLQDFAQDRADALFRERSENHHCPGCTGHLMAEPTAEEERVRRSYGITSGIEALEDMTGMALSLGHALDDVRSALEEVYPDPHADWRGELAAVVGSRHAAEEFAQAMLVTLKEEEKL